jgi:hypothetical protein
MTVTEIRFRKRNGKSDDQILLEELHRLHKDLDNAYNSFELLSDGDLVEATIYEIEALKARYRHLLCLARQRNIRSESRDIYGC